MDDYDNYMDDPENSVQQDLSADGYSDASGSDQGGGGYMSAPSGVADYSGADRLAALMDARSRSALDELKAARARATASLTAPADKSAMWLAAAGALLSPTRYGGTFADSAGKAAEAVAPFAQRNADQRTLVNRMLAQQDMSLADAQYNQSLRAPAMTDIYENGGKQKVAIVPGLGAVPIGGVLRTQRLSQAEQLQQMAEALKKDPSLANTIQLLHPANRTSINMPPEESQFNKDLGAGEAKQVNEMVQGASEAPMKIAQWQRLNDMLQQIKTGRFTGDIAQLQKGLSAVGIDPKTYGMQDIRAVADAVTPMINTMALQFRSTAGGAGMPGSLSDTDREFLKAMLPTLDSTPEAVPLMTGYFTKMAQRQAEIGNVIDSYRAQHNGRLDPAVISEVRKYNLAHPIFDANDIATLRQITGHLPHGATTNDPNDLQGFQ